MGPFDVADALRVCLTQQDWGDETPAEICHRPGSQVPLNFGTAQDECCSGLAWVRIAGIDPVIDPQQAQDPDFNPCTIGDRRITLELGVARCNPFGTEAAGPTCAEWTALALRMDQDATVMRAAVCCLNSSDLVGEYRPVYRVLPGSWAPLDSSGGCAGGTMSVVVWMQCDEC
jgi:hypothetical protein